MNTKYIIPLFILTSLLLVSNMAVASEDGHDGDHEVAGHCETPTAELIIKSDQSLNSYEHTEYQVEKNTCYELKFENRNEFIEHDVNIDLIDDGDVHMDMVHIHVANNIDGDHGIKSMTIQTPDVNTELTIYCSIDGHQVAGMEAILIVGDGNSTLPFNSFYALLSLFILGTVSRKISKRS